MKNNSVYTRGLSLVIVVGIIFLFVISLTISYAIANQGNTSSNKEEIEENKLNVVTSVSPITNIVQNIGGVKINLIGLVPEGVNSHTFEFIPSDLIKINSADLIIIDGLNMEANIEKIAENAIAKNSNIQLLKLGENTISKEEWIFDFSFPKEMVIQILIFG
jgi:ABC-type Zn uptake system ZnuABC Zn-binding protein ZnuA